jgi:hypothetical protein
MVRRLGSNSTIRIFCALFMFVWSSTLPSPSLAFRFSDGNTATCRDYAGRPVPEVVSPIPLQFTGVTGPTPNGGLIITWDSVRLRALPSEAFDFIYFHECAHANVPTSDELEANCRGLIDMRRANRSSATIEQRLAAFHTSLGEMGPRYGNGQTYWRRTVECANASANNGPPAMGNRCRFDAGPLAGTIRDYRGIFPPLPVGTPCNDGIQSSGRVVR